MITVRIIDKNHEKDINIPNESFALFGRLVPTYTEDTWHWYAERWTGDRVSQMCFPDEHYDYDAMTENSVFLGAYDGEKCVGLAILQQAFFKYMYLYDLKVNSAYRGQGVGTLLMNKAREVCLEQGYNGIYTQGQDNNLGACLFYLRQGFIIGGLDCKVYQGTPQEGKRDVLFYLDCK